MRIRARRCNLGDQDTFVLESRTFFTTESQRHREAQKLGKALSLWFYLRFKVFSVPL